MASTQAQAQTQNWPDRPIKFISSQAAGNGTDVIGRLVADRLSARVGQPIVFENRPGGGNVIGTQAAVRSAPDGYTFFFASAAALVTDPYTFKSLPYDPMKDFAVISRIAEVTFTVLAHPDVPVKNLPELFAYAKANPGKINMASSGNGTSVHLSGELFRSMTGIDMVHVPYKGAAPALTDMLGGRVQVIFDNLPSAMQHIKAGTLRALAVTTETRSPQLPDVPTVGDTVKGYEASAWFGVGAPKNTPRPIIEKLNKEINAILAEPAMKARLDELGGVPLIGTPEDFGKIIQSETDKWAKVVEFAKIKVD